MVDPETLRRIGYRALFAGLCAVIAFFHLLPVHVGAGGAAGPDLPVLLVFAWVLRRPGYVPVLLVAPVMLALDILLMRPLGLWSALAVLAAEVLRRRGNPAADLPFPVEWMLVGAVLAAMTAVNTLVLALLFVPYPTPGASALQVIVSAALYPLVVAFSVHVAGVRPASPAERDAAEARA